MAKRDTELPSDADRHQRSAGSSRQSPSAFASSEEGDSELLAAARDAFAQSGTGCSHAEADDRSIAAADAHPGYIGQYRIVSVLGQGGMGVVYEAEQQHPRRPVALKVVRGGRFIDEHHIRLFQREAQTLARLRHPGIAAIYESGRTENGRHFFAMELVRGRPMNRYVNERFLPLESRLDLFCKTCEAINYAHQRGVIHRDLKPSNIIIDANENPKILDFGLAKITDSDVATATVVTHLGSLQGTLAYMSPEQARGNPDEIDLLSDVYSLGVILYELVTDRLPLQVEGSALHEAVRAICETAPPRPSRIKGGVPSDLETIILKALAKEPTRRYHSALALAEDVERFRTHQAILARPPSTLYLFRKLVARHRAASALVLLLFLVVTAFGFWNRALFRAEQAAHHLAVENAETASEVSAFLMDIFQRADPNVEPAEWRALGRILHREAARIRSELKDKPAVQAALMVSMSKAYQNLGLYEPAAKLLRDALSARRALPDAQPLDIAECNFNLAWLLKDRGLYGDAEAHAREALRVRLAHLGAERAEVAWAKAVLGAILFSQGRLLEAERLLREATVTQQRIAGPEHQDTLVLQGKLGDVLREQGRLDEAEAIAREVLGLRQSVLQGGHPHIASAHSSLAAVLLERGRYEEAEREIRTALSIRQDKLTAEHQYSASASVWLSRILRAQGRYEEAVRVARLALEAYRARLNPEHPNIATSLTALGWALYDAGGLEEAGEVFRDALEVLSSQQLVISYDLCNPLLGSGSTLIAAGRADQAETHLRQAMEILDAAPPRPGSAGPMRPWLRAQMMLTLGRCLRELGRHAEAEPLLRQGLDLARETRGESDRFVLEAGEQFAAYQDSVGASTVERPD